MQSTVFTIGHSNQGQEQLISLLLLHGITAIVDVRSKPYSRFNPQFNREDLEKSLLLHNIAYRFLGKELGARSDDPTCYEGGKVRYERIAQTELFQLGIARVWSGVREGFRIALMCAEKEPLECHRTILVTRHLVANGLDIQHIHQNGSLESHADALTRLRGMLNLPEEDLFRSRDEVLVDAYRRQEERIAYEAVDGVPTERPAHKSAIG